MVARCVLSLLITTTFALSSYGAADEIESPPIVENRFIVSNERNLGKLYSSMDETASECDKWSYGSLLPTYLEKANEEELILAIKRWMTTSKGDNKNGEWNRSMSVVFWTGLQRQRTDGEHPSNRSAWLDSSKWQLLGKGYKLNRWNFQPQWAPIKTTNGSNRSNECGDECALGRWTATANESEASTILLVDVPCQSDGRDGGGLLNDDRIDPGNAVFPLICENMTNPTKKHSTPTKQSSEEKTSGSGEQWPWILLGMGLFVVVSAIIVGGLIIHARGRRRRRRKEKTDMIAHRSAVSDPSISQRSKSSSRRLEIDPSMTTIKLPADSDSISMMDRSEKTPTKESKKNLSPSETIKTMNTTIDSSCCNDTFDDTLS